MSKPQPWVKYEQVNEKRGRFIASPLQRGMGVTLGNSLRRVLLSSLHGHAITSIKIDGVDHEFSSIPNVVEDVFDVISNIKNVVFKAHDDEPKTLRIESKGKGVVLAKDITSDADIEIVNPDQYIAEVADKGKLEIEMVLQGGKGYEPSETFADAEAPINTIAVDASFSPIVRVNHEVKNIRVGKELDYDQLTLDVWTNGGVSPETAVKQAAEILLTKFELFRTMNEEPVQEKATVESDEEAVSDTALELTIDDLELSARSSNCLKRAGIETVAELVEKDLEELTQIKNFGKKSADEINDKLKQYSLALKGVE